jgi:uncharacterized membrane protein
MENSVVSYIRRTAEDEAKITLPRNVGSTERILSLAAGGLLAIAGLSRRSAAGGLLALTGAALLARGASGYCPVCHAVGRSTADDDVAPNTAVPYGRGIRVEKAVTVARPAAELYAFWRRLETLPTFMHHLESVTKIDDVRSRWVAKGPAGTSVAWDAEVINEVPDELIGWKSAGDADVDHAGSVHFETRPDGATVVRVILRYDPPAGKGGALVAKIFREDPATQIEADLARFKQLMEAGEIPTVEGQPRG